MFPNGDCYFSGNGFCFHAFTKAKMVPFAIVYRDVTLSY